MIDIDVAVRRRRDFALNRHLYIFSLAKRLGLIGGLAPQLKKKIKINPFEALLI